jgi:hypothetical protein
LLQAGVRAEVPVSERDSCRRGRQTFLGWAGAAIFIMTGAALVAAAAVLATRQHDRAALTGQQPAGIPAAIPSGTVNLMGLSPVPASQAPGFGLTHQDGHRLPLSGFRGKVVVLEFQHGPGKHRRRSQSWGFKSLSDTCLRTC